MTRVGGWSRRAAAALGAALFLIVLGSLFGVAGVPRLILVELCALALLAALRPEHALVLLAVTTPVAGWVGRQWNPTTAWAEAGAVAFCAGYCLRCALAQRTDDPPDTLDAPVLLTSGVVLASLAAQLLIDDWRFGAAATLAGLRELATGWYFLMASNAEPIDAAMRLLESLIILRAAATVARGVPEFGPRLIASAVVGAALAAALNLLRLWEGAARLDTPAAAFVRLFMHARFNISYGDVNAAGSYFVLTLFAAAGLALAPRRRAWLLDAVLIASSVWVTSSRTAMIFGALALLLPAGALAMRIRGVRVRSTVFAASAVVLTLAAGMAAYAIPQRGNQQSVLAATRVRVEMAATSLRMTASSPAFGIGIGRYYTRSGEFSSPELLQLFPPAVHENAHNNFLQFLAELGIVGLAAIAWLLWSCARLIASLLAVDPRDPVRWGLVTGLVSFVLSWLGGHPLLLDEPALTFWLLLGVASGWGAQYLPLRRTTTTTTTRVAAVLTLLVSASVPLQVLHQRAAFDLEHRGIGLSPWQTAIDGVRYRLAAAKSSVFVPASAQMVIIPLRSVALAPEVKVELSLDGRPADVVTIVSDRWHYLRLQMTRDAGGPRFRRLDLRVTPDSGDASVLMVGKIEPR
ncbi:MAG TPA: O-antigen ligase family protein [Vicinamibacterales bacterium]|nr:O-antigen ligase family protein [Vicinamibacterales bacterium]